MPDRESVAVVEVLGVPGPVRVRVEGIVGLEKMPDPREFADRRGAEAFALRLVDEGIVYGIRREGIRFDEQVNAGRDRAGPPRPRGRRRVPWVWDQKMGGGPTPDLAPDPGYDNAERADQDPS